MMREERNERMNGNETSRWERILEKIGPEWLLSPLIPMGGQQVGWAGLGLGPTIGSHCQRTGGAVIEGRTTSYTMHLAKQVWLVLPPCYAHEKSGF